MIHMEVHDDFCPAPHIEYYLTWFPFVDDGAVSLVFHGTMTRFQESYSQTLGASGSPDEHLYDWILRLDTELVS